MEKTSRSTQHSLVKNYIFGVGITNATKNEILEYIFNFIQNSSKNCYIVTPNSEMLVAASRQNELKAVLNGAKLALNDGIGVSMAGKILGQPFKTRFSGADFVEKVCEKVNDWPITVGFLGGGPGIAEKAAECLKKLHANLNIAFVNHEWNSEGFVNAEKYLVSSISYLEKKKSPNTKYQIQNTKIDILFVAFGFPKQELWMQSHLNKVPVRIMVGVGGALDYISGTVPRAPRFMRAIGLEWLFRLVVQPWRIKRQLALVEFIWMVAKERFSLRSRV